MGFTRRLFGSSRRISFPRPGSLPVWETLETRTLLSAAFDLTGLTALRADPVFNGIDGSGLSVAVLDTGLFASHQDISGNFLRFFDAVKNGRNAKTDPGTANSAQAFDPPGEGHGTHVAGIVGSTNSAIGVATGTDLISVRVLPGDGDSQPQVNPLVAGLEWVLERQDDYNIRVVNMSLGSNTNFNSIPNKDDVGRLIDQLEALGVTVVAASGNSYGGFASLGTAYPSIFSTIAVANTWEDSGTPQERNQTTLGQGNNGALFGVTDSDPNADQLSASSQRSTLSNQVAAPGTTIFSTWNGDGGLLYNTIAGTSMASPFVAGTVALMQEAAFNFGGRYLTPDEVLSIIRSTADNIVDVQDPGTARFPIGENAQGQLVQTGPIQDLPETGLTYKRVNVHNALREVRDFITGGATPTPTPTPTDPGQRTDDTNNTLAAATAIPSLNGLAEFNFVGNVGSDGGVNVGARDIDLYRIDLDAPGFPVFTLNPVAGGQDFDPLVRLFDAAGNPLASQDDTLGDQYPTLDTADPLSTPLDAGTYYLGVSSFPNSSYNPTNATGINSGGSQGDYQVTIGLSNPDPNGVVQGAFSVDLTNPNVTQGGITPANFVAGNIGSDPNPFSADGEPRVQIGAEDVDFYEIVAPDTGRLTIDIDARSIGLSTLDSFVNVYSENLTLVGSNDDETFPSQLDSLLTVDVTQGTKYFVAVTTFQNRNFSVTNPFDRQSSDPTAVGNYNAYFSFNNGDTNGTVVSAVPFASADPDGDGTALGVIGADQGVPLLSSSANGGSKDVDFFTLTPTQPGLLDVVVTGESDFDGVIGLWTLNADSELVALGDTNNAPSRLGLKITDAMIGNALFVSVTGVGNQGFNPFAVGSGNGGETGNYTLSINQQSEQALRNQTNDSIQSHTPESVTVGEPLRRDIGRDGTIDVGADDIDIYRFDSPFTGTLTVRTDTSDEDSADTFLRAFSDQGVEITFNNNAGSATTASSVTIDVMAGRTYYFGVNGASPDARNYNALTGEGAAPGSEGHYVLTLEAAVSDLPLISINNATATEILGDKSFAVFTLSLSQPAPAGGASVSFALSDDTARSGSDYVNNSQVVNFAPGSTSATVSVQVIGDFDNEDTETFRVMLSAASGALILNGSATGTIINAPAPPPMIFAGRVPLTYTSPSGAPMTLSLKGQGSGSAFFAEGSSTPSLIVLNNTTPATTLRIKGAAVLPALTVNGSLRSLGSRTTVLTGDLNVTGSVGRLAFDDLNGVSLSLGEGRPVSFSADQLQDVSIQSASPFRSIKVSQWTDTDTVPDVLDIPAISSLSVKGDFEADVASVTLGKVRVGGAVSGSNILVDESIANLTVGSIADSAVIVGNLGGPPTLPDAASDFTRPDPMIRTLTVRGKAPGSFSNTLIAAASLGKVNLGSIATSNSGTTFGVATLSARSVRGVTDATGVFKRAKLDDPADSLAVGEFVLRLL